jgi:hypothetical protein
MKRNGRLLLPLALILAGCPADERRADPAVVTDTPLVMPPTGRPAIATSEGDTPTGITVEMSPRPASTISGEAMVEEVGTRTRITVRLVGSRAGVTHQGHVHTGTCASPAGVVQPLQPITADATGTGTTTTEVDIAPMSIQDGRHVIVYHEGGGQPGAPAACAEIPAHPM